MSHLPRRLPHALSTLLFACLLSSLIGAGPVAGQSAAAGRGGKAPVIENPGDSNKKVTPATQASPAKPVSAEKNVRSTRDSKDSKSPRVARDAQGTKTTTPTRDVKGQEKATPAKTSQTSAPDKPKQSPAPDKPKQTPAPDKAKGAAPLKPDSAAPDVSKDPEFPFQGEFAGTVVSGSSAYQQLALQVRPLAPSGFEALQYQGGLPGEPAHRPSPLKLIGKRFEKFLVLSGGPFAIFVEPEQCLVLDQQGQRVGRLVRVHRQSPTLGAPPPKDALVLFDGKGVSHFSTGQMTKEGLLMEGADLKELFADFNLHVEFQLPYMPAARDQGRANSGVYLQSRYELQVLDSFGEEPVFNGCGALYRTRQPDLNMCLPPLVWQTYDIAFTSPRWLADGTKWKNARVTIWHNGVKIHNNVELEDKTGAGKPEDPMPLPIRFQDHRNPVRYRNIWIVDRGALAPVDFPPVKPKAEAPAKPKKRTPERTTRKSERS